MERQTSTQTIPGIPVNSGTSQRSYRSSSGGRSFSVRKNESYVHAPTFSNTVPINSLPVTPDLEADSVSATSGTVSRDPSFAQRSLRGTGKELSGVVSGGSSSIMSASPRFWEVTEETMINIIDRLAQLHDLRPDWDSYGALPITRLAEEVARELLVKSWNAGLIPDESRFDLMPIPTGGLQLEWEGRFGELEIEIHPDGTISSLRVRPDETSESSDDSRSLRWEEVRSQITRTLF